MFLILGVYMVKGERSNYSVDDLFEWYDTGKLTLTPKFQRRKVWNPKARSFLIDSILLDMPIPPIFIRVIQSDKKDKVIREVIDGQQRLSSVFDYMKDEYALSKNIEYNAAGKLFSKLTTDEQNKIRRYTFICEVFQGLTDNEVLKLFSRLNVYSVKLNEQELRHGQFFGVFKQVVYNLGIEYLEFWKRAGIFSDQNIARMFEAEFVSELLILMIDGPQDKKKSITQYYLDFDDNFPNSEKIISQFENLMNIISDSYVELISKTEFRRSPIFYAFFGALYHRLYGLKGINIKKEKTGKLTADEKRSIQETISYTSNIIELAREGNDIPKKYTAFVSACMQQTDNLKPRITRIETIYNSIFTD